MLYDFNKVKVKNMAGKDIKFDAGQFVSMVIGESSSIYDLITPARKLFETGKIDLRDSEVVEIRKLILASNTVSYVKKTFIDFFDEMKKNK